MTQLLSHTPHFKAKLSRDKISAIYSSRMASRQENLSNPLAVTSRLCGLFQAELERNHQQSQKLYEELVELLQAKICGDTGNLWIATQHQDMSLLFLHFVLESLAYELNIITSQPKSAITSSFGAPKQQQTNRVSSWSHPSELDEDVERLGRVRSCFEDNLMDLPQSHSNKNLSSLLSQLPRQTSRRFHPGQEQEIFVEWNQGIKQLYHNLTFELFYGVLLNREKCCACKETSCFFSLFSGVSADLEYFQTKKGSRSNNVTSIEEVVERSFSPETDTKHWCSSCRFKVTHERESAIYEPPLLMLVDLQNPSNSFEKSVYFKIEHIGLHVPSKWDTRLPHDSSGWNYNLRGFVCAHKEPQSGTRGKNTQHLALNAYELIYYCDKNREWLSSSEEGLKISNGLFAEKNNISYCLYEYTPLS